MTIDNNLKNLQINDIFKKINNGIRDGKDIEYFVPYYKVLSEKTIFPASTLTNEWFYRARLATDKLFTNINELKYPPRDFAIKGRLNDTGEQVAYLSAGQIGPLAELDINFYQLFCLAKIKYFEKDILFHSVGVKNKDGLEDPHRIEINRFYQELLTSKGKEYYNATIALARHFMGTAFFNSDRTKSGAKSGIIYNSVNEDKSNKPLYNVAVYPHVFDKCFKIEETCYYALKYEPKMDAYIITEINKGIPQLDGTIIWDKTYSEMIEETTKRFSRDIFIFNKSILHFKYGVGEIVKEDNISFLVSFRSGKQIVLKNEILLNK